MPGLGTGVIDFGPLPGSNVATVSVTGQGTISSTSSCEAFLMAEAQAQVTGGPDHTVNDAIYASAFVDLICETPTAGVGFPVHAVSEYKMTGAFKFHWVWSD